MSSKPLISLKFKGFWRWYVDIVVPVILGTVDSIMPKLHNVSVAEFDSENLWVWACDDSVQYLIHDLALMLISKVCHTILQCTSIILDVKKSEMCVVGTLWRILNNFNYWTSYRKILKTLLVYSGCITTVIKFLHKFLPFFVLTARLWQRGA